VSTSESDQSQDPATPTAPVQPVVAKASAGRFGEARERVYATRDRVYASRGRYHQVDVALRTWERDVETGGSLMAAALAFRLFLWTLPAALFTVGVLGFTVDESAPAAASDGIRGYTMATVEQAASQAHRSRWLLVIVGGFLLLYVSYTLTKTVVVATALVWNRPLRSVHRPLRAVSVMLAAMTAAIGLAAMGSFLRNVSPGLGLVATVFTAALWGLMWWVVSYLLPHADNLPWWGLLPGAVFLGIGTQLLHLATVYYFGVKLGNASEWYGPLGVAATLLLWAYIISRLVLASASINVATVRTYHRPD
jgi:uncharacterized BrkB/YihY/UPF0761 family membrane protein